MTIFGRRLVQTARTVTVAPAKVVQPVCGPDAPHGCGDYPLCGHRRAERRFTEAGALSHRSDAACDRPAGWGTATYRSHGVRLTDTAPRGYGTMTVSMFGGPRTPGAADQGELSA